MPASVRKRLGIVDGETQLIVRVEDDGRIEMHTREQALAWIDEQMRKHIPAGVSLADELIEDRRAEALRERRP